MGKNLADLSGLSISFATRLDKCAHEELRLVWMIGEFPSHGAGAPGPAAAIKAILARS
jgi:hypothetical protein